MNTDEAEKAYHQGLKFFQKEDFENVRI